MVQTYDHEMQHEVQYNQQDLPVHMHNTLARLARVTELVCPILPYITLINNPLI